MLSTLDISALSRSHESLWPSAKQRPDSNPDVVWVWRRVCGENTLEACTIALRRHAARSKFPARPGDIADLLPAPPAPRPSGPSQAEVAAYIAEARERCAALVPMSTDRIREAWRRVCLLLGPGGCEDYAGADLDPLRPESLHPDLQYKLCAEAANVPEPAHP